MQRNITTIFEAAKRKKPRIGLRMRSLGDMLDRNLFGWAILREIFRQPIRPTFIYRMEIKVEKCNDSWIKRYSTEVQKAFLLDISRV